MFEGNADRFCKACVRAVGAAEFASRDGGVSERRAHIPLVGRHEIGKPGDTSDQPFHGFNFDERLLPEVIHADVLCETQLSRTSPAYIAEFASLHPSRCHVLSAAKIFHRNGVPFQGRQGNLSQECRLETCNRYL